MTDRKKVLILTNHSYMLYQFRRELICEILKRSNVTLSMPFTGHEKEFVHMGCKCIETSVERRGVNPVADVKLLKNYLKILKKEKPEYVITYSIKPNIYGGLACSLLGVRYYINITGLGTAFQNKKLVNIVTLLYRISSCKANKIFVENEENRKEIIKRKIVKPEKVVCLPGAGINLNYYSYTEYPRNKKFHWLYLGRIMKEKGIGELFDAVKMLNKKYGDRMVLDLVGFFEDEYKQQVVELETAGIVTFYGFQEETREFYELADCVVLPSYHEGMSNVILEAAACGRPIIASNISGCRESIEDGVTGFLCEKGNVTSLFDCMERMFLLDYKSRRQMGIIAREKMYRDFDKNTVVAKTLTEIGED